MFERIDNSTNRIIEKFGDFLPGERSNWSSQVDDPSTPNLTLTRKSQFPGSNAMVRIILAETAHLDVSRLFRVTDVKLRCPVVERACDVIYHFWARIMRVLKLF